MITRSKSNPFAQSPQYWKVTFTVPESAVAMAEEAFSDMALSITALAAGDLWAIEVLCGEPPDKGEVQRRLLLLSTLHGIDIADSAIEKLEQQDWLAMVAQNFPPLSIGRFFVHGSHVTLRPASAAITIQVDAGAAFGSGEHSTTRCCLEALDWLGKKRSFRHILDMGCGSGILAIAAAKLWRTDVLAADLDPVAVQVTEENIQINREQSRITALVSDGYASERIRRAGKFDLIIANILARPLIELAPDLARHLSSDGVAVLSGLLVSQEAQVLSAHLMQGLKLHKRFVHQNWCTLVLKR